MVTLIGISSRHVITLACSRQIINSLHFHYIYPKNHIHVEVSVLFLLRYLVDLNKVHYKIPSHS